MMRAVVAGPRWCVPMVWGPQRREAALRRFSGSGGEGGGPKAAPTPWTVRRLLEACQWERGVSARATHSEVHARCLEQVARLEALAALGAGRPLRTLTALYAGLVDELGAIGLLDESDAKALDALHRGLRSVEDRHSVFVPSVVDALKEGAVPEACAALVEDCLAAHIGAAALLRNHLAAHAAELENPGSDQALTYGLGAARNDASIRTLVDGAVTEAAMLCEHAYDLLDPPPVRVVEHAGATAAATTTATTTCVPAHSSFVLLELIKNAVVATVEKHIREHGAVSDDWTVGLPPVVVTIVVGGDRGGGGGGGGGGLRSIRVEVEDDGGGMPPSEVDACLALRPGLKQRYDRLDEPGGSYNSGSQAPISGIGMGLPLSKLYAAHFGGRLHLESTAGATTKATYFVADTIDHPENLPPPPAADQSTPWARR